MVSFEAWVNTARCQFRNRPNSLCGDGPGRQCWIDDICHRDGPFTSTTPNVVFTQSDMISANHRDTMYTLSFPDIAGAARANGPHPNGKRNRH